MLFLKCGEGISVSLVQSDEILRKEVFKNVRKCGRKNISGDQNDEFSNCKPINVSSLTQNGDPMGRKDLGKCVVKWLSLGMKAMARDFGEAELQGEFSEVR